MPRCACASEVYTVVCLCVCVCVSVCPSVCLCRLLLLLKDESSASKSFYRLLVMFSWIRICEDYKATNFDRNTALFQENTIVE